MRFIRRVIRCVMRNILPCVSKVGSKLFLSVVLLLSPALSWADRLYMLSQNGDYIGQGLTTDLDSSTHTFTASINFDNGVSVNINGTEFWSLAFAAPADVSLQAGIYDSATRFPFQGPAEAGLSVSGNGRGCNTLSGRFTVLEAVYLDNTVVSFAADFEQHCGSAEPGLFGAIRINSQIPIDVTIPSVIANAGTDLSTLENQTVFLDGSASYSDDGSALSYQWEQLSGPLVFLSDPQAAQTTFVSPTVILGGATAVFRLTAYSSSASATDELSVNIISKSDPQTYVAMQSEAGDYIGQGMTYLLSQFDGNFNLSSNDPDVLSLNYQGGDYWYFNFATPDGANLNTGLYAGATRYPFNPATEPGLSVSGAGRGCNTLSGQFEILQLSRDSADNIDSFAIDFEQHCESAIPALTGQVRYNFVHPSVPTANAGADQNILGTSTVFLDALASYDSDGNIAAYQWQQLSGTPVSLLNPDSAVVSFTPPALTAGELVTLSFRLTVTDDLGYMAADEVIVTITGEASSYCDASGLNTYYEWIDKVTVNNDVNISGDNAGFGDYSGVYMNFYKGGANTIVLTPGFKFGAYTEYWKVWLDANQDGSFTADEEILSSFSNSSVSAPVSLPAGTLTGETRLRVAMRYGGAASSCGSFYWGEVEDYTAIIQ